MNIKHKVRVALLELENKPHLNTTDQKVIEFIVGEGLNEAGNDIISRFMSVVNSKQRRFITAAVMTALLANPSFSQSMKTASEKDKAIISSFMSSTTNNSEAPKDDNAVFTLNFNNNFESGKYEINKNDIQAKMEALKNFLLKHPESKFKIMITASESQVPNQDNLKVGQLAKLRVISLEKLVNLFLKGNDINVDVEKDTKIGKEAWDGKNKDDQKYTQDQYVKLDVFVDAVEGTAPCEISFTKADGGESTEKYGYISFEETVNESGSMTISPGSIPDRLVIMKGDKVVGDTGYFVDKQHNYQEWNLVPLYVAQLTQIYANNPDIPAIRGLNSVKTFNSFEELLSVLAKTKYDMKKDTRSEISNGLNLLQKLWNGGQREFIMYSMKKGTVDFEINQGESGKVVVYSPVGKTGFGIQGKCE